MYQISLIIIIRFLVIKTAFIAQKMVFIIVIYELSNKISESIFIIFLLLCFRFITCVICLLSPIPKWRETTLHANIFLYYFFLKNIIFLLYLPNSLYVHVAELLVLCYSVVVNAQKVSRYVHLIFKGLRLNTNFRS